MPHQEAEELRRLRLQSRDQECGSMPVHWHS